MSIMEEIEDINVGVTEPEEKDLKSRKFVSGNDNWAHTERVMDRGRFVKCAKAGCIGAKQTLIDEYDVKVLVLDGQKII